jgi:NAD(P)-dependent dehydrogenase (short-subunit alcohol dehydrogenase family)
MHDFTSQIAVITGASGNLGSAAARRLHAAGAHLVLLDHAGEKLSAQLPELVNSKDHLTLDGIDVTNPDSMSQAVGKALERFGQIDILVNTVGGYRAGTPLYKTPVEDWDFMLNLNARSVFVVSQAVIPAMVQQHYGKIIHVSARAGVSGAANSAAYSAAKSAVIRLTESMAAELKQEGVNVNCILPGTIDTPQNRQAMPSADFHRWVSPESIAEVILFLASDAARDIHGAAIPVYGKS